MRKVFHRQPVHKVRIQGIDVSKDVVSVSIRKNVSGSPNIASVTLVNTDGRYNETFSNKKDTNYIKIWLGNYGINEVMPCEFYGYVTTISRNFSAGQSELITLSCESFVRIFGLNRVFITRPTVYTDVGDGEEMSYLTGRFSKLSSIEIVKKVIEEGYSKLTPDGKNIYRMEKDSTVLDLSKAQNDRVPYPTQFQAPLLMYHEYLTPAQIINEVATRIDHEFYDDGFTVYFKQPDYILPVNDILAGKGIGYTLLSDSEIINYVLSDSDRGIYTIAIVSGTFSVDTLQLTEPIARALVGEYHDKELKSDYGERILNVTNPSLYTDFDEKYLVENPDAYYTPGLMRSGNETVLQPRLYLEYGRYLIERMYRDRLQGEITVVGRSGIKLGSTVYVPVNDLYYHVYSVSHEYNFGKGWLTTIGLRAGRSKDAAGLTPVSSFDFSANDSGGGTKNQREPNM